MIRVLLRSNLFFWAMGGMAAWMAWHAHPLDLTAFLAAFTLAMLALRWGTGLGKAMALHLAMTLNFAWLFGAPLLPRFAAWIVG